MALVFHRGLAIPLWGIAFFAVALVAPLRPIPPVSVLVGISLLCLTMLAALQWWRTSRTLVPVPVSHRYRTQHHHWAHRGFIMTRIGSDRKAETVSRPMAGPVLDDDALDLVRMDDDGGGWQMARESAVPAVLIPGARERGMLTGFETTVASARIPDEPSTMDAATTAERQREGGGAPSQRRPARARSQSNLRHTVQQFLVNTRALFTRRPRINHV